MRLRNVMHSWDRFLFAPVSTINISLLRIIWGTLTLANILMMLPERFIWFGPSGILGQLNDAPPVSFNVMHSLVTTHFANNLWFVVLCAACVSVIVGAFTRASLILVWLMLTSMAHTNLYILHSGDTLLRLTGFFLIFSHAGESLSIDSYRAGRSLTNVPLRSPWAQRLIQLQLCLVYFTTAWWKLKGTEWNTGSAVGLVLNLLEFERFPLPDFMRSAAWSPALTGFAVTVEMLFPLLVWFRETRVLVLFAGLLLHVGMEWSLNIQLFQPIILSLYVLFLSPEFLRTWVTKCLTTKKLLYRSP